MSFAGPVYAIVNVHEGLILCRVDALLRAGVGAIQLRAKPRFDIASRSAAHEAAARCRAASVPLIINDDFELAETLFAAHGECVGVHLGQRDVERWHPQLVARAGGAQRSLMLGLSTHDVDQVRAASASRPDYLGFGPIFPTSSKSDPDPVVGLAALKEVSAISEVPVVAIGGIDRFNARRCLDAGATAVAAIGALQPDAAADPLAVANSVFVRAEALSRACAAAGASR